MNRSLNRIRAAVLGITFLLAASLGACSSGGTAAPGGSIQATGAWARAAAAATTGAAYAVIKNTGSAADALIGAESPVSANVEVHETYVLDSPAASGGMGGAMGSPAASGGMGGGAAMGMRPIKRLEIPAGGSVELKPGSYHIMMMNLKQDLKAGDKIELTLIFEKAGRITVTAEVRTS